MPSAENDPHPVLAAMEQAILDLLEEFEEGHGPLDERDAEVFEEAKDHLRRAVTVLRQG
ncbi:hypothetical protein J8J14_22855 [Roseomonas sp. SSH11]|uniref:Uncharacterized protein n=1 Tax=Pararoseomonas baculiformis TaxID=2820812 RepID=A0ABS4AKQ6_9PROT|nr:hypothetical protein [Pararoseomonas baculiformis]MBP0447603.1 hypothetical protein [Pararoseomonas baculiformis]